MHPLRGKQRELQLDFRGALVVLRHERVDDGARDLGARRRHGRAGAAELQCRQQHLHGGEIAGVAGAVDLNDQTATRGRDRASFP